MASTKMKVRVRKKSLSTSVSKTISKETSPDSKCPICLDQFKNISYVDKCLHRFCFRCIHEWSKNKAECPLCKQPFSSIYHSIKAEDDFKQFDLQPTDNGSFGSLAGQRFRYRTTLTGDRRASARRTSSPPDHGVMFEGLAGPTGHGNDRGFQRMLTRLEAWQRAQGEGRPLRTPHEQDMIRFRRTLYRRGLWVRGVRDGGRSRETSAEFFRRNPACLHRLVPWLKRELTILYGTHGSLVNIVQHIVMSQITRYDMQDTAVLQELRPFLLSRTEHFLHEFLSFARSPFNMAAYDQHAVYDCPAPSAEDSSSSDLSVIALSEDEAAAISQTGSSPAAMLSHTAWDDETPGPSYSSEPPRVFTLPASDSDTDSSAEEAGPFAAPPPLTDTHIDEDDSGEEDCVVVGYVKPTAERTPELVQLSSDSEESVQEEHTETSQLPQHIRFLSEPTSPASNRSEPSGSAPNRSEPCGHAPNRSEPSGSTSSFSAAKEEYSLRRRTSPQTSSKARPSLSEYTPSQRQKRASKSHRREAEADRRHHSKKTQKDKSRSRNRERSSHYHRRRSHSRSPCSRERVRASEGSGCSLFSRPPYTLHYERDRSSRYHMEKHTNRSHASPGHRPRPPSWSCSWSRSWSRSRARSRSWSCARSRSRARYRSWSRAQSRLHAHSRSWSRARSRSRSRARSRSWSRWERRRSESRSRNSSLSSHRKSQHKPGGKHTCKSLHTEQSSRGQAAVGSAQAAVGSAQDGRRSKEEHRKKSRRRSRRRSRSPSVEIVYEGGATERRSKRHRKKKKRKKSRRSRRSKGRTGNGSPTIITIPSGSEADDGPATHLSADPDSAHSRPRSPADTLLLSTTPTVPADAPQPPGATGRTASPLPLGGALQPFEEETLATGAHGSADDQACSGGL